MMVILNSDIMVISNSDMDIVWLYLNCYELLEVFTMIVDNKGNSP